MADIRKLTKNLSVAPQLVATDVAEIAEAGFRSILCNRPDQEEQGQPFYEEIKKHAEAAGLVIEFQPVNGSQISDTDIDEFDRQVHKLPQPVLAYCRTGTRCSVLWALSQAGLQPVDEILATTTSAGYALEALRERIVDSE